MPTVAQVRHGGATAYSRRHRCRPDARPRAATPTRATRRPPATRCSASASAGAGRQRPRCLRQLHVELLRQRGDQERDGRRTHHQYLRISDTKWGAKIYGSDCSPITNDGDYVQIINFDVTGSCVQGITTNGNYTIIGNRVYYMPGSQLTAAIVVDCCSYTKTGNQVIGNVVDNIGLWGRSISLASSGPGARPTTSASTSIEACLQKDGTPEAGGPRGRRAAPCGTQRTGGSRLRR